MDRRDILKCLTYGAIGLVLPINSLLSSDNTGREEIFLTIDDGPASNMPLILRNLKGEHVTFYLVGEQIAQDKNFSIACQAIELGNVIGNHSYTHPEFSKISLDNAKREIERTEEIIRRIYSNVGITRKNKFFRFPYGDYGGRKKSDLELFLTEGGYNVHFWDIDTEDWMHYRKVNRLKEEYILQNCRQARNGDIVLTHDNQITADKIVPFYVNSSEYRLIIPS